MKKSITTTGLNRLKYPKKKKPVGISTSDPEVQAEIIRRGKERAKENAPDPKAVSDE